MNNAFVQRRVREVVGRRKSNLVSIRSIQLTQRQRKKTSPVGGNRPPADFKAEKLATALVFPILCQKEGQLINNQINRNNFAIIYYLEKRNVGGVFNKKDEFKGDV